MAAMAVVALGRVGMAQGVDLAVVGVFIGLVIFLMTTAALRGNGQFDGVRRGVADAVRGVAVGADGGLQVVFL